MLPNQTMIDEQGYQVCLFPMTYMNVTQGFGLNTYSHCCGCPFDYGTSPNIVPVYAPCDMHLTYNPHTGANTLFYSSDNPVNTPSGISYVSIQVTHCRSENLTIKQNITQGELFYYSGDASGSIAAIGIHLHMDQSLYAEAVWMNYHIKCTGTKKECWGMEHPAPAYDVFYVNDTDLVYSGGYPWKVFEGGQPEPPSPPSPPVPPVPPVSGGNFKWWMAHRILKERR